MNLPVDIIWEIFNRSDFKTQIYIKNYIYPKDSRFSIRRLIMNERIPKEQLLKFDNLTDLHLNHIRGLVSGDILRQMTQITKLNISYTFDTYPGSLTSLTNLTHLSCDCVSSISDQDLSGLTRLKYLSMTYHNMITDDFISRLPDLISLKANECSGITDFGLAMQTNLTELHISYSDNITDKSVATMTKLTKLAINDTITMDCLNKLGNLRSLCLLASGTANYDLKYLTRLQSLCLSEDDGRYLEDLPKMTNLTKLIIFSQNMQDQHLSPLTGLRKLIVHENDNITNDCLTRLSNLRCLKTSNVNLNIDDNFARNLGRLQEIRFNSKDISALTALTNLTTLEIYSSGRYTFFRHDSKIIPDNDDDEYIVLPELPGVTIIGAR